MTVSSGGASISGPRPLDTLLMLSGGIDSAWTLWQRAKAGLRTRTHHVTLADHEGRAQVEDIATRKIVQWVRDTYGHDTVVHTESKVDFGTVRFIPYNVYLWMYWAGTLFADPQARGLTDIAIQRHLDVYAAGPFSEVPTRSDEDYKRTVKMISGREPTLVYPMVHLTKEQVVRSMPRDLLELCWYCRTPVGVRPCGKCGTCRLVAPTLDLPRIEAPAPPAHEPPVSRPTGNASKAVWAAYAESLGVDTTGLTLKQIKEKV